MEVTVHFCNIGGLYAKINRLCNKSWCIADWRREYVLWIYAWI